MDASLLESSLATPNSVRCRPDPVGHSTVKLRGRKTVVPMHGKKDLKTGTLATILKDLAITKDEL